MRILSELKRGRFGAVTRRVCLAAGVTLVMSVDFAHAVQNETHEEKAANLKKQALGGLFKKWTFDQDPLDAVPVGFTKGISNGEVLGDWVVQSQATAPSPAQVVVGSSSCTQACYQVLLAEGMQYEYPDLSVRFFTPEGTVGSGGVVLGARDTKHFYAAIVDLVARQVRFVRLSDGLATVLAHAPANLKPVDWHSLRVQRNTIISKDFIEVFVDGVLALSVEDQALGLGQIGLVLNGQSTMWFDSVHAVPLFSHRPLSAPPAY